MKATALILMLGLILLASAEDFVTDQVDTPEQFIGTYKLYCATSYPSAVYYYNLNGDCHECLRMGCGFDYETVLELCYGLGECCQSPCTYLGNYYNDTVPEYQGDISDLQYLGNSIVSNTPYPEALRFEQGKYRKCIFENTIYELCATEPVAIWQWSELSANFVIWVLPQFPSFAGVDLKNPNRYEEYLFAIIAYTVNIYLNVLVMIAITLSAFDRWDQFLSDTSYNNRRIIMFAAIPVFAFMLFEGIGIYILKIFGMA